MAKSSQVGLHVWLPMAMEGLLSRALLKLHYKREYPVINFWSSVHLLNFGKTQEEGQSAGNFVLNKKSSETRCEAIKLNEKFKWWLIGFAVIFYIFSYAKFIYNEFFEKIKRNNCWHNKYIKN